MSFCICPKGGQWWWPCGGSRQWWEEELCRDSTDVQAETKPGPAGLFSPTEGAWRAESQVWTWQPADLWSSGLNLDRTGMKWKIWAWVFTTRWDPKVSRIQKSGSTTKSVCFLYFCQKLFIFLLSWHFLFENYLFRTDTNRFLRNAQMKVKYIWLSCSHTIW